MATVSARLESTSFLDLITFPSCNETAEQMGHL